MLCEDPDLVPFSNKLFFVWDTNHYIQTWMPYISRLHGDDPSWHIFVDSILFNTSKGLVEVLIAMIDLNK
jgi:hypothetical protein